MLHPILCVDLVGAQKADVTTAYYASALLVIFCFGRDQKLRLPGSSVGLEIGRRATWESDVSSKQMLQVPDHVRSK